MCTTESAHASASSLCKATWHRPAMKSTISQSVSCTKCSTQVLKADEGKQHAMMLNVLHAEVREVSCYSQGLRSRGVK
eukprot:9764277-Alexandrium_andersonii.AAC.1